jgi:4-amino-4-deoxy-L-arabinose transferase-like glycosyltransferase
MVAFCLIFLAALFFRLYRLDSLPAGMHTDQGLEAEYGIWVLRGWRPFYEIYHYQVPELLMAYLSAAWYWIFGSSYLSFHGLYILLAMLAFPFIYWTFRQWTGPRTALSGLAIMALMRWNWTAPRNMHAACELGLFLFAGLAFWLYGIRRDSRISLLASALVLGLGFYTYQLFKVVPLLFFFYALYEKRRGLTLRRLVPWAVLLMAFALPLLAYFVTNRTMGNREKDLFIGQAVASQKSLAPVWRQTAADCLMFNRRGDGNPRHNLPGTPMLDGVTGVLFVLGLGLAWLRRRDRAGLYPLAGFLLFMAVGSLTDDPANSNRLWILSVFAAYFAGLALEEIRLRLAALNVPKLFMVASALILLALLAVLNARVYFDQMAHSPECQMAYGKEQTYIGQSVENLERSAPDRYRFFIPSLYFLNHTVKFFSDASHATVSPLSLDDWTGGKIPKDKDSVLFLEQGKTGIEGFFKTLFPEGQEDLLTGPDGQTLVYRYQIPKESLVIWKGWNRGLVGTYWTASNPAQNPVTVKTDPLLNFSNKEDFPFQTYPPFFIRWQGTLDLPQAGTYQFEALTWDWAKVWVDGKPCFESGKSLKEELQLGRGAHTLRVDYRKTSQDWMALHLIWKIPGSDHWEVMPATAFGTIKLKP